MSYLSVEPKAEWLGSRRFWLICIALFVVVVALASARSVQVVSRSANPVEVHLYGQPQIVPGQSLAFRVLVIDGKNAQPISGAPLEVALIDDQGRRIELGAGRSDGAGGFVVKQALPAELGEGAYQLVASTSGPLGSAQATHSVSVARSFRILLTTDKPLYQPGQLMHLRALALNTADQRPAASRELLFEVLDGKGNKVFKQKVATSQFGIAATDFALADQVNSGDYAVSVSFGGASAQRSIPVKTYVLPKFRIELTTDRAAYQPGDKLSGELRAIYTFGQPVAGARVRLIGSEFIERFHDFTTVEGTTDEAGRYKFDLTLPPSLVGQELSRGDAMVKLVATVSATAGGEQQKSLDLIVAKEPLRIEAVAESGELLRGVRNRIYLVVSSLQGEPLAAQLAVKLPGNAAPQTLTASRLGVAQLEVMPDASAQEIILQIGAEGPRGEHVEVTRKLPVGMRMDGVLLRPERAVYRASETVRIEVLAPGPTGRVFLDVVKDRRTVMMHAFDVKQGRGTLSFDLPPDLTGTLELCAYTLRNNGEIVRDVRLVQVHPRDELEVSLAPGKPIYAPGDTATVDIRVSRRDGTPVAAALGLVGVDEAVYALYDTHPGLEQLYFTLQEELLKPRYELHAHLPPPVPPSSSESRGAELDEAQTVLLSAAAERAATEAWPGTRFADRQKEYEDAAAVWFRSLTTAAVLTPIGIFAICFFIALGFAISRLFQSDLIRWEGLTAAEIERVQKAQRELSRSTGRLLRGWIIGVLLPPLGAVAGSLVGDMFRSRWREREQLALGAAFLCALVATYLLWSAAKDVRAAALSAKRPLFRKIVKTIPFAYFMGALGIVVVCAAAFAQVIAGDGAAFACLAALGIAVLYLGVLSVLRQTSLRAVSGLGWFWLFLTRPLALALPGLLFMGTMVSSTKSASVREERMPMMTPGNQAMGPAEGGGTPTEGTGAALKEPTRVRRHFPETLLWRPEVLTDTSGKARLTIPLADSITTWRLAASAVTASGELGGQTLGLRVFQDFFVDIEFPATLTQHDEVSVPVSLWNYLDEAQTVRLELDAGQAKWLQVIGPKSRTLKLASKQTASAAFRVRVLTPGKHTLTVRAAGSALADAVERPVTVLPDGQPVTQIFNGRLDEQVTQEIAIPEAAIDGGSDLYLKIYPGAFSQVVEGLDGIFHMPYGCFEQTSSTTYPSVLALDYLRRTKQTKPDLELKALQYIGLGYQRLLSFEVSGGGFEWFGHAPAHNLLTAYGLLEFSDMARVYAVDPALLARTRRWLWSGNRDGRFTPTAGGIAEGAINQYRDDTLRATAYITWALATADRQKNGQAGSELAASLDYLASGDDSRDPYTLALRAQALLAGGRVAQAKPILDTLDSLAVRDKDQDSVYFTSKSQGVTYSFGESMSIETTGLVAQALLAGGGHHETANQALKWLVSKRDASGTWGSTQATIAAMRALLAGTEGGGVKGDVNVAVLANDQAVSALTIKPETSDVYRLVSLRAQVKTGKNSVGIRRQGKGDLAYQIVAIHHVPWTRSSEKPEAAMSIAVRYDTTTVKQDQILGAHASVRWNRAGTAPMTLVDLGIPPGFDVLADDLDGLVEKKQIERYSNTGRQLIVYLSAVEKDQPVTIDYRLRARYPVRAKTPASRAYPYYEPEAGGKSEPALLVIE